MAEKNCKLCFHYDVCYAVGRMPERAETCSKYAPDVEEVKHGYWIVVGRTEHGKAILKCSHCERVRKNHGKSKFCCDCGAKMDGGKE